MNGDERRVFNIVPNTAVNCANAKHYVSETFWIRAGSSGSPADQGRVSKRFYSPFEVETDEPGADQRPEHQVLNCRPILLYRQKPSHFGQSESQSGHWEWFPNTHDWAGPWFSAFWNWNESSFIRWWHPWLANSSCVLALHESWRPRVEADCAKSATERPPGHGLGFVGDGRRLASCLKFWQDWATSRLLKPNLQKLTKNFWFLSKTHQKKSKNTSKLT